MEIYPGIEVKKEVKGGIPVIRGTRIPVNVILEALASGMSPQEVAQEYEITEEDVRAVLAFASERIKEERYFLAA